MDAKVLSNPKAYVSVRWSPVTRYVATCETCNWKDAPRIFEAKADKRLARHVASH